METTAFAATLLLIEAGVPLTLAAPKYFGSMWSYYKHITPEEKVIIRKAVRKRGLSKKPGMPRAMRDSQETICQIIISMPCARYLQLVDLLDERGTTATKLINSLLAEELKKATVV